MRLRAVLEDEDFEVSIMDGDAEPGVWSGVPASIPVSDDPLPLLDRNQLIGLLHSREGLHGASIIVLTGGAHPAERELPDHGATAWIVKPADRGRFVSDMRPLVH